MRLHAILFASIPLACAADLGAGEDETEPEAVVDEVGGPNVGHVDEGDGIVATVVDATSETDWVYLRLSDGRQVEVSDPLAEDAGWDLGFQRFHIKLAGGISGSAGVEAAPIEGARLEDIDAPPAEGWITDAPDGDDDDDPDYALRDWYAYDVMTHVLTPRDVVWAIRTGEGEVYGLRIEDYYDDAGTSGHLRFRWGRIDAP